MVAISKQKYEKLSKEFLKVPDFWILSFENVFWQEKAKLNGKVNLMP